MALVYASPAELETWSGSPAPENATALLRFASLLVGRATRTAFYATVPSGLPRDDDTREAFRDATAAQAAYWAANNLDPAAGAVAEVGKRVVASKSIGGASITYESSSGSQEARAAAATGLCDEAWLILDASRLVGQQPWSYS